MPDKVCKQCGGSRFKVDARGGGRKFLRCLDCRNRASREQSDRAHLETLRQGGEDLLRFGSPIERVSAEALLAEGSVAKASLKIQLEPRELRAHLSELRRRAAGRGYSPSHDMTKTTPEGYQVKGVSSYYKVDPRTGESTLRGQWVKTKQDEEHRIAAVLDAMSRIADRWQGLADPVKAPKVFSERTMTAYPMGDPHIGMYAWAAETGQDFDLQIAERNLVCAVDHLVELAPASEEGLIINLGDFYHADNSMNQTMRSHHALDVDTRWGKVLAVGLRTMRRCIDRALTKHQRVHVINEIGNHDDHSALMLSLCLQQYYEREPRVTIDTSPAKFHWYRFGKCLIGVTHGHNTKLEQLPMIMAADRREDWGSTDHHYFHTGHVHHDQAKEIGGVICESHGTMAPADAWSKGQGFRSRQAMKCIVYDREYGEINRHTVGIKQIWHTLGLDNADR
jgi:hypothetical protein